MSKPRKPNQMTALKQQITKQQVQLELLRTKLEEKSHVIRCLVLDSNTAWQVATVCAHSPQHALAAASVLECDDDMLEAISPQVVHHGAKTSVKFIALLENISLAIAKKVHQDKDDDHLSAVLFDVFGESNRQVQII